MIRLLAPLLTLILSFGWHQIAAADFRVESGPRGTIVIDSTGNPPPRSYKKQFPELMRQVERNIQGAIASQMHGRRLAEKVSIDLTPEKLHIELHNWPDSLGKTSRGYDLASPFQRIQEIIAAELGRLPSELVAIEVQHLDPGYEFADGHQALIAAGSRRYLLRPELGRLIQENASRYLIQPALVQAVICCESNFDPQAVSPKGAKGLMQLMPGTITLMRVKNPFNAAQNIAGGTAYLRYCLDRFHQDLHLALAAYNAGPNQVDRYGSIPPFQETRMFVRRVLAEYNRLSQGKLGPVGSDFKDARYPFKNYLIFSGSLRYPKLTITNSFTSIIIDIYPCK